MPDIFAQLELLEQINTKRGRLAAEMKSINDRVDGGDSSPGLKTRMTNLQKAALTLDEQEAEARKFDGGAPEGMLEHGDGARPTGDGFKEHAPAARGLKGRALTAVEKCIGGVPDAVKEATTRLIEQDQDEQGRLAQYIIESSATPYLKAFRKWLSDPQNGTLEWEPEERHAFSRVKAMTKAMSLGTTTAGGFLVPYQLDPQIMISSTGYVDPMREVARVERTVLNEARFVTSAGVTASWDAEAAEVSDDSPTLAQPAITNFKGQAFVPVSFELFEDSTIGQQVGGLFADAKATLEASAFTTGTGSGQPKGVITAVSAVGGSVLASGTNALAQSDLYTNQAALPARWRPRAQWMMNLSILNGFRQLPQATGLNYSIINDDGPMPKALGWNIWENNAMDGTLTGAAADYAVLSGDFKQYIIVDRLGTTIEFIPNLFGASGRPTGQRGFLLHWRSGGDAVIPDAFRLTNYST